MPLRGNWAIFCHAGSGRIYWNTPPRPGIDPGPRGRRTLRFFRFESLPVFWERPGFYRVPSQTPSINSLTVCWSPILPCHPLLSYIKSLCHCSTVIYRNLFIALLSIGRATKCYVCSDSGDCADNFKSPANLEQDCSFAGHLNDKMCTKLKTRAKISGLTLVSGEWVGNNCYHQSERLRDYQAIQNRRVMSSFSLFYHRIWISEIIRTESKVNAENQLPPIPFL